MIKEDLKVSVIINVFNAEIYISNFLNSLLGLTYKNCELLIIDDGSTDNTLAIAKQFKSDFNIKYFSLNHQGLCSARSFGFQQAEGDICVFLDVDEEIKDKHLLEKFVQPFEDEIVGGVGGNKYPIGNGWLFEAHSLDRKLRQFLRKHKKSKFGKFIMGGVFAVRRKLVLELGGLSNSDTIVEDSDISIRIRRAGRKLVIRDDIQVGHPDPVTIRGTFIRAVIQGRRIFNLAYKYPKEIIDIKLLLAYFPLWVIFIGLFNWYFAIALFFLSYISIQFIYILIPDSYLKTRTYLWILLWINGTGIVWGSLIGVYNQIKNLIFNK